MSIKLFPAAKAVQCDHGRSLAENCYRCESQFSRTGIRDTLILLLPFWLALALVLAWWLEAQR